MVRIGDAIKLHGFSGVWCFLFFSSGDQCSDMSDISVSSPSFPAGLTVCGAGLRLLLALVDGLGVVDHRGKIGGGIRIAQCLIQIDFAIYGKDDRAIARRFANLRSGFVPSLPLILERSPLRIQFRYIAGIEHDFPSQDYF